MDCFINRVTCQVVWETVSKSRMWAVWSIARKSGRHVSLTRGSSCFWERFRFCGPQLLPDPLEAHESASRRIRSIRNRMRLSGSRHLVATPRAKLRKGPRSDRVVPAGDALSSALRRAGRPDAPKFRHECGRARPREGGVPAGGFCRDASVPRGGRGNLAQKLIPCAGRRASSRGAARLCRCGIRGRPEHGVSVTPAGRGHEDLRVMRLDSRPTDSPRPRSQIDRVQHLAAA